MEFEVVVVCEGMATAIATVMSRRGSEVESLFAVVVGGLGPVRWKRGRSLEVEFIPIDEAEAGGV
jgi:hypothetical protein